MSEPTPPRRPKLTAEDLRALIAEVEEMNHGHRLDELKALVKEKGGSIRYSAGTYTARIGGLSATCTMGETHAVTAWANRARRRILELEG